MEKSGLMPDVYTYGVLIHGLCMKGSYYRALRLLKEMRKKGMVPNVASYSSTIGVLCNDGKWEEAEMLLKGMMESDLKPSVSLYNIISRAKNDTLVKVST
ncbi:hypothetical protein ACLB2K_031196 [Fragaria x ananassa]